MMMIEAMKQALEALEHTLNNSIWRDQTFEAITALRQAIAEAEKQEPVCDRIHCRCAMKGEWAGLTDEEIHNTEGYQEDRVLFRFAKAIEQALKEKNT
jgi:hypothetical protein